MAKTITLHVKEQPFEVEKLGHRRAKGWRKQFEETLVQLAPQLKTVDPDVLKKVDLTKTEQLEGLITALFGLVEEALDSALELVIKYAGESLGSKDTVEDDIYDEEIVADFIMVVRTAIPFDELMKMFKVMNNGQLPPETSTNSVPPNGESTLIPTA